MVMGALSGPEAHDDRHEALVLALGPMASPDDVPDHCRDIAAELVEGCRAAGLPLQETHRIGGWWDHVTRGPIAVRVECGIDTEGVPVDHEHSDAVATLALVGHDELWWEVTAPVVDAFLSDHNARRPFRQAWSGPDAHQLRDWQAGRDWRDYDEDPTYIRQVLEAHPGTYPDAAAAAVGQLVREGRVVDPISPQRQAEAEAGSGRRHRFRR